MVRERFKTQAQLTFEDQATYYNQWYYSALHVLSSVPAFQTLPQMAKTLGLPRREVSKALEFLTRTNLVRFENGRYSTGETRIHLPGNSPLAGKQHVNWRLQGMRALEKSGDSDLHYTSIVGISKSDFKKLKAFLVDAMERYNQTVAQSPEECCACLTVDFFEVGSDSQLFDYY